MGGGGRKSTAGLTTTNFLSITYHFTRLIVVDLCTGRYHLLQSVLKGSSGQGQPRASDRPRFVASARFPSPRLRVCVSKAEAEALRFSAVMGRKWETLMRTDL